MKHTHSNEVAISAALQYFNGVAPSSGSFEKFDDAYQYFYDKTLKALEQDERSAAPVGGPQNSKGTSSIITGR